MREEALELGRTELPDTWGRLGAQSPGVGVAERGRPWLRRLWLLERFPVCPQGPLVFLVVCGLVFKDHWEQLSLVGNV